MDPKNIKQLRCPDQKIWLVADKNYDCGFPWVVTATGWGAHQLLMIRLDKVCPAEIIIRKYQIRSSSSSSSSSSYSSSSSSSSP